MKLKWNKKAMFVKLSVLSTVRLLAYMSIEDNEIGWPGKLASFNRMLFLVKQNINKKK